MNKPLIFQAENGAALVVLSEPIPCACGTMAMMLVNGDGKTRCMRCVTASAVPAACVHV